MRGILKYYSVSHSSPDRPTGVAKLQQLSLIPGACLTVLVLEVTSPSCFIAQPYGPELVQLMDDMG